MTDPGQEKQTLKFYFTPRQALAGELDQKNPHAKDSTFQTEVVEALGERFGDTITGVTEYASEHTVFVEKSAIVDVCRHLKEEMGYTYLSEMGTIDRFTEENRFEVYYSLVNMKTQRRLRIKVRVDEENPTVPSVISVFRSANWHERETWEMFGINFVGHPALRHIYLPGDFEGHPLRKDFPLVARLVKPWPGIVDVEDMPAELAAAGVHFFDATSVFADVEETLYRDDCCHFNGLGNDILGSAVAEFIRGARD